MADIPAARAGDPDATPVISVAELLTRDGRRAGALGGREVTLPPGVRRDPGRPTGLLATAGRLIDLAWKPQFRVATVAGVMLLTGLLANALLGAIGGSPRPTADASDGGYPSAEAPAATDPGAPASGQLTAVPVDRVIPAPARVAGSTPLPAQPVPRPAVTHPAVKAPTTPVTAAATAPATAAKSGGSTGTTSSGATETMSEPTGLGKVTDRLGDTATNGLGGTVNGLGDTVNGLGDAVSGLSDAVGGLLGGSPGSPSKSSHANSDDDSGSEGPGGLLGEVLGGGR